MTTNNSVQPTSKKPFHKNPQFLPLALIGGLVIIGLIGFLTYSNLSKDQLIDQKIAEMEEIEALRVELEAEYNEAIAELEDMRAENEEMNALIDAQRTEIEEQRSKVAGLISNKKKLKSARAELEKMKTQIEDYLAQIEYLKSDNQLLTDDNLRLKSDKELLQMENEQLNEAKAILVSEKTSWNDERNAMSKQIKLASIVKVKDIKVDGFKEKGNGKLARKKNAKAIDHIQVCFKTTENEIANAGLETFLVRIVNPLGETLAIDDLGSGESKNLKTGENFRFTKAAEVDYLNDESDVCVNWSPDQAFQSGLYLMEIYNKGYLVGERSFEFK